MNRIELENLIDSYKSEIIVLEATIPLLKTEETILEARLQILSLESKIKILETALDMLAALN